MGAAASIEAQWFANFGAKNDKRLIWRIPEELFFGGIREVHPVSLSL